MRSLVGIAKQIKHRLRCELRHLRNLVWLRMAKSREIHEGVACWLVVTNQEYGRMFNWSFISMVANFGVFEKHVVFTDGILNERSISKFVRDREIEIRGVEPDCWQAQKLQILREMSGYSRVTLIDADTFFTSHFNFSGDAFFYSQGEPYQAFPELSRYLSEALDFRISPWFVRLNISILSIKSSILTEDFLSEAERIQRLIYEDDVYVDGFSLGRYCEEISIGLLVQAHQFKVGALKHDGKISNEHGIYTYYYGESRKN